MSAVTSKKALAQSAGAALAAITVWVIGAFGVPVPAEVAVAFGTIFSLLAWRFV